MAIARQPKGSPTGGQFAPTGRDESDLTLDLGEGFDDAPDTEGVDIDGLKKRNISMRYAYGSMEHEGVKYTYAGLAPRVNPATGFQPKDIREVRHWAHAAGKKVTDTDTVYVYDEANGDDHSWAVVERSSGDIIAVQQPDYTHNPDGDPNYQPAAPNLPKSQWGKVDGMTKDGKTFWAHEANVDDIHMLRSLDQERGDIYANLRHAGREHVTRENVAHMMGSGYSTDKPADLARGIRVGADDLDYNIEPSRAKVLQDFIPGKLSEVKNRRARGVLQGTTLTSMREAVKKHPDAESRIFEVVKMHGESSVDMYEREQQRIQAEEDEA